MFRNKISSESDNERLQMAKYRYSSLEGLKPLSKPAQLCWELRPRNSASHLGGPAFVTSQQQMSNTSQTVENLQRKTLSYFDQK